MGPKTSVKIPAELPARFRFDELLQEHRENKLCRERLETSKTLFLSWQVEPELATTKLSIAKARLPRSRLRPKIE